MLCSILIYSGFVISSRLSAYQLPGQDEFYCRITGLSRDLSGDTDTARKVGQRHGKPVIYTVDGAAMHADGYTFYRSVNGVWLTKEVPVRYLSVIK